MWSYTDRDQTVHTRLSARSIRILISRGVITENTLLSHSQFKTWHKAGDTLFYTHFPNVSQTSIPIKRHPKSKITTTLPQTTEIVKHHKEINTRILFFLLALLITSTPLIYLTTKFYKQEQAVHELQNALIDQQDLIKEKATAIDNFAEAEENYIKTLMKVQSNSSPTPEQEALLRVKKMERLQAEADINQFSNVINESEIPSLIQTEFEQLNKLKSYLPLYMIGLILPLVISWTHHITACRSISKSKKTTPLGIIHCIPLVQFFCYSIVSLLWNIESIQRKNNLLLTLPINLALIACLGFSIFLYQTQTGHALTLLLIVLALWAAIHCRQLSMIAYIKKRR